MDEEPPLTAYPLHSPLSSSSAPRDMEPDSHELEKLRRWQEERMARKLRGEYESAVLNLGELINNNLSIPLRIASVRIEGAAHTRRSFLDWLLKPQLIDSLTPFQQHQNLGSVLLATRSITQILRETDIFSIVEPKLEASRAGLSKDGDIDVVFKTKEKGKWYFKTATELGDGEGSASIQGRVRNLLGGAETLEANIALGTRTRRAFNVSLSAPLTPTLKTKGEILLYGVERDHSSFASAFEEARGVKTVIRTLSKGGINELAYEAVLRQVGNLAPTASLSMREAAGHTLKSAISHTWLRDTRDDKITDTRGSYLRTYQELAGFGGDAAFYKSQNNVQISRLLFPGTTISFGARTGIIWPLFSRKTPFPDRFQLGGPLDIRLFKQSGLGPKDGPDSLGGDLYWATGISLISDLPRKPNWPLKIHFFVNAGRLDALDQSKTLASNVAACISRPSVSAGVGLIYRFDPVRVEVNFGVPLVASKSDSHRRGFQIGIGLDFL